MANTKKQDLSTDKGWTSNSSDFTYNATNDSVDLATLRRSTTSQEIYIDLQDSDYLGSGVNLSGGQLTVGTAYSVGNAGIVTSQGFRLADNKQIKFGTGDDSGMYYTGSHLYIDNNTAGDTYLRSTNINLQVNSASSSENALVATANGAVDLYHNGTKTFNTESWGNTSRGQILKVLAGEGVDATL